MKLTTQKKLDKVFSKFIRKRDSKAYGFQHFQCISCGKIKPYAQADCGHFINRRHSATRYDEQNCNAQCRDCNSFEGGNPAGYSLGLSKKYGNAITEVLYFKAKQTVKITDFEGNELIKEYKAKTKELEQ